MSEEIQEQILNETISGAMDMISPIQSMLEDRDSDNWKLITDNPFS